MRSAVAGRDLEIRRRSARSYMEAACSSTVHVSAPIPREGRSVRRPFFHDRCGRIWVKTLGRGYAVRFEPSVVESAIEHPSHPRVVCFITRSMPTARASSFRRSTIASGTKAFAPDELLLQPRPFFTRMPSGPSAHPSTGQSARADFGSSRSFLLSDRMPGRTSSTSCVRVVQPQTLLLPPTWDDRSPTHPHGVLRGPS